LTRAPKQQAIVLLAIASLLINSVVLAHAQSGFGLVEGRVICSDGGTPARGASVQLIPLASLLADASAPTPSSDSPTTTSDFNGAYSLFPVAPGIYIVDSTMNGYADDLRLVLATLKRHTPEQQKSLLASLPQITVKAGGNARQDLILRRAGAVFGKVFVDTGGALSESIVTATLVPPETPSGSVSEDSGGPPSFSQSSGTDDRGGYRISGLPPGNYRVSVRVVENFFDPRAKAPQETERIGFADLTVFAPEMLNQSDAKLFKVAEGDEISNVDITVPTELLHSLSGIVTRGGRPVAGITLSLEDQDNRVLQTGALSMLDGSYHFDLLPDGEYTVIAKNPGPEKIVSSRRVSVQLHGTDVMDLMIDLSVGAAR
jgi:hypothetical protein